MAENIVELLTDVADAIRVKKGSNEPINAQNFANEIKNLPSGSSPFAVDFGEEIATMDPFTLDSLREDIDYYNEIQRKRLNGEVTDAQLLNDQEFIRRIAWIPEEMTFNTILYKCHNLRSWNIPFVKDLYNNISYFKKLEKLSGDVSHVTRLGFFLMGGVVGEIDLSFDKVTNIEMNTLQRLCSDSIKLNFPEATKVAGGNFSYISGLKKLELNIPKVTSLSDVIRDCDLLEELYFDISSVTRVTRVVYNFSTLKICHIKGLQVTLSLNNHTNLQLESVKYILDNCKAREDGAAYTLTIHANVKSAFLAKCDEDAEYAASLASATEKGLTLA